MVDTHAAVLARAVELKNENERLERDLDIQKTRKEEARAEVERLRELVKNLWNNTEAYNMGTANFCQIKEDNPWMEGE